MSTTTRRTATQVSLTVEHVEWLTEAMVRIVAGGSEFADFTDNGFADHYVKLFFISPGTNVSPPFDFAELRERLDPADLPVRRTYTLRWVDTARARLAIDFVVHGDEGVAGPWAASAVPGDTLIVSGPGGKFSPAAEADWHLFAGDESAAPAIASGIEALSAEAQGIVYLEVDDDERAPQLPDHPGMTVHLVYRGRDGYDQQRLRRAVEAGPWYGGDVDVFAHGEREQIKELRKLFKERAVPRNRLSISGYWAHGRTEDRFQAEKREPIGRIDD